MMKLKSALARALGNACCGSLAIVFLAACTHLGALQLEIDLGVAVSGPSQDGRVWHSRAEEFSPTPEFKQSAAKYQAVAYNGALFSWRFFVAGPISGGNVKSGSRIGNAIRCNVSTPICFRFDQARLSSSMHPEPLPLHVNWTRVAGKPVFPVQPTYGTAYTPDTHCFGQAYSQFDFGPEFEGLFPNGTMFNIALKERSASL